ncbi:hypothetical protein J132_09860 [Termitomyces sp. J132]|nr:hypothetical protein J132_09860 [Termitomyces sp. J132]
MGPIAFSRYANEEDRTQSASVVSKPRICDVSSDSISKIFPSTSSHDYATSPLASLTLSTQNSNHDHPPHIDLLASFNRSSSSSHPSPDPVSPIFFSSPTSSNNAVPCRHSYHGQGYCPSLEFSTSPSWETSFDTFNSLRIESGSYDIRPEQMLNPSRSQPFNTFDLYNNNDSSTELEVPTIPMLTTLSLPGSLDTTLDVSRRNSPRHHHAQDNSHTQDSPLLSSPLSVSEATGTNKNDSSTELEVPTIPMLTTLSLPGSLDTTLDVSRRNSPRHNHGQDNSHTQNSSISSSPLSISEATGTVADITALEFPSPPLTLSPFITAPAPESPVIDLPIADSSTVEYASAVVSSSWGPDISIHPDYPLANILPNVSSSSASETSGDPGLPQESTRGTKTLAMITKFKTLGRKMKKFLSLFPNAKLEGSISNNRTQISQDGFRNAYPLTHSNDIGDPSTEAGLRREDSLMAVGGSQLLPLPPGLSSCLTRRRPVTPEMFIPSSASLRRSQNSTSPPVIRITSSSCSYQTPMTDIPDERMNDLDRTEDSVRRLEIDARPKTLEEIKSKRRFSLSILSNTRRSVSQSSSSVVAVAHDRQRPRSAIVLPAVSSSSISGGATLNNTHGLGSLSNTISNHPEDEIPMEPSWTSIPGTASLKRRDLDVNRKKHQRFSLPTLSHLTKFA